MPSDGARIRYLLDEHYLGRLADGLVAEGIDAIALTAHCPELRGADDQRVLDLAATQKRVVVTEDATTFSAAMSLVPWHVGVIFCHHARYPRTRPGIEKLRKALVALAGDPPPGLGVDPVVWWLAD
jgi:predicted nuclease of predicted toxin-antitoxin system